MTHVTPIRKIKEGAKASFYEAKTSCSKLKITIYNGDDDYPIRIAVEPVGGGCLSNIEAIRRLITLLLEMNARADVIIEQLNKVICPACKSAMVKGDKDISLSCAKAMAGALEKHLNNEDGKDGQTTKDHT